MWSLHYLLDFKYLLFIWHQRNRKKADWRMCYDVSRWIMDTFRPSARVVMSLGCIKHVWKTIFSRSNPSWILSNHMSGFYIIQLRLGLMWSVTEPELKNRKNLIIKRHEPLDERHIMMSGLQVCEYFLWQPAECKIH